MEKITDQVIEWGVASLPQPGQAQSGDMYLVKLLAHGALVAVIDGLGHGQEAAQAAKIAAETLDAFAGEPLIALVNRCHEALRQTRGVVMSLACFQESDSTMTWLGVGDVEGVLLHQDALPSPRQENLVLKGGLLGNHLPHLVDSVLHVARGDLLIFATDGIRPDFAKHVILTESPQRIADRILAECRLGTDDALTLVVRCAYGYGKISLG